MSGIESSEGEGEKGEGGLGETHSQGTKWAGMTYESLGRNARGARKGSREIRGQARSRDVAP